MGLDVVSYLWNSDLKLSRRAAAARYVEAEKVEQRQVAADQPAVLAFEREGVVLPIDDLERVDPQFARASLGVHGVKLLLDPGSGSAGCVCRSLACQTERYPFRLVLRTLPRFYS